MPKVARARRRKAVTLEDSLTTRLMPDEGEWVRSLAAELDVTPSKLIRRIIVQARAQASAQPPTTSPRT